MNTVSHHLRAAEQATARGKDTVAIRHLRKAVRLVPAVPDTWALLGDRLLARDAFDAAIRAYRRALALYTSRGLDPRCLGCRAKAAAVHAALASAQAGTGDLEQAVRSFEAAIDWLPCAENYVSLGEIHEMAGRPERARWCYQEARRSQPRHVPALLHLADLDLWTRPDEVRRLYLQVLDVEPGHHEALASLAAIHMQDEAWDAAQDCAEASVRARPTVRAWVYLGHLRLHRGDLDAARDAYGRAQRLDPGDVHPLYALGDLEREEGDVRAAELAYREALSLDPASADAALRLARLLFGARRQVEEARTLARKGLALAPHHPWADDVRRWLATVDGEAASA